MQNKITIIEPQMESVFHVPFNASFIHSIIIAFPDSQISFIGMENHVPLVKRDISNNSTIAANKLLVQPLQPPKSGRMLDRWIWSWRLFSSQMHSSGHLVLTSVSRMHLIQLQVLTFFGHAQRPFVVLHGDIEALLYPPKSLRKYILSMAHLLKRRAAKRLKYFVLGKSIYENIPCEYSHLIANSHVVDHPYHFLTPEATSAKTPVFGIFGNSGDGQMLFNLVSAVHAKSPDVKFVLIGFVGSEKAVNLLSGHVHGVTHIPITRGEYERSASLITHAIFLTKPDGYRLRASGALFDVMSFLKPVLFLSNSFVNHYWKECPALGTQCTDITDMAEKVVDLASNFDEIAYRQQQIAIHKFRERFTPEAQAVSMAAAFLTA